MKIILYCVIIFFTTYLGYLYNNKYVIRYNFYSNYYNFIIKFKNDIAFNKKTIISILKNNENKNDFEKILENQLCNGSKNIDFLTKEENEQLSSFVLNIGMGDMSSQITYLDSVKELILNKTNETLKIKEKYNNVFIKIGFLVGLIIVIVLL